MDREMLVREAKAASAHSYAPYSQFRVGAALLAADGTVFRGVNVENRSYGLGICAERSAITAAVSAGKQEFAAIAVFSPDAAYPISPCGACRQVLSEFLPRKAPILFIDKDGNVEEHTMEEVFPFDALHELRPHD
ncbi:MAG: cytidine deaminase [Spirochaetales bacterium]